MFWGGSAKIAEIIFGEIPKSLTETILKESMKKGLNKFYVIAGGIHEGTSGETS